jgi:hypothetical protein
MMSWTASLLYASLLSWSAAMAFAGIGLAFYALRWAFYQVTDCYALVRVMAEAKRQGVELFKPSWMRRRK